MYLPGEGFGPHPQPFKYGTLDCGQNSEAIFPIQVEPAFVIAKSQITSSTFATLPNVSACLRVCFKNLHCS